MAIRMACCVAAASLLASATPAMADVKAGVDAWAAGQYDAAVKEWQGDAAKGDPDAQFNLAQAYRLGRGVPRDDAKALDLYSRAAEQGHLQAADNYGMMLFQAGKREEAMPYVQAAADRGDPRAQYLLGIAHFNGDIVPKDWVRAYALLTLSNSTGLPQAAPALAEMDKYIPLEDRQKGVALSSILREQADARLAQQLAAADLGVKSPIPRTNPAPAKVAASPKVPSAIPTVPVAPSVAAAEAAVAEAIRVTGTDSPATAGADFARPGGAAAKVATAQPSAQPVPQPAAAATPAIVADMAHMSDSPATAGADYARPAAKPAQVAAAAKPAPKPAAKAEAPASAAPSPKPAQVAAATPAPGPAPSPKPAAPAAGGSWRVQLGSFSVPGNADKMWSQLSGKPALAGKEKVIGQAGKLTVLSASGFASREAAASACSALKQSGQSCLVSR